MSRASVLVRCFESAAMRSDEHNPREQSGSLSNCQRDLVAGNHLRGAESVLVPNVASSLSIPGCQGADSSWSTR